MKYSISIGLFFFISATQAFGEGRELISEGIGVGRNLGKFDVPSGAHRVTQTLTNYDRIMMANPSHPLHGATGDCFDTAGVTPPQASGAGNCVFTDADGDLSASRFEGLRLSEEGVLIGIWIVVGGTGKFAGSTGGGRFHSITDPVTGQFENRIEGAMMLK